MVSFTKNQGFITEVGDAGDDYSSNVLTNKAMNVLSSGRTGRRMTGNPIKFIEQRSVPTMMHTSRSNSVAPYYNRSRFGDRINDHVRLLRESWDRYIERSGAN